MKLKFNASLEYQLEAIDAVTDLFDGLPPKQSSFEISFGRQNGMLFSDLGAVQGDAHYEKEWGHPLKGESREKTPLLSKKSPFFAWLLVPHSTALL